MTNYMLSSIRYVGNCLLPVLILTIFLSAPLKSFGNGDPWFPEGIPLDESWVRNDVLGDLYVQNRPWFYSLTLGWFYFSDSHRREGVAWLPDIGWVWTSPETYPFLYGFEQESWLLHDFASTDFRWVWDQKTGEWLTLPLRSRPNVVLITADDLGLQLGTYGDPFSVTPNLDQLAAEGLKFENAYVAAPTCSSSRSAILTGLYPHENGQVGLEEFGFHLKPNIVGLPLLLGKAGYETGIIGKLHVAPARAIGFSWFGNVSAVGTRDIGAVRSDFSRFIDSVPDGKPFFLMLNFFDPHRGFVPSVGGIPAEPVNPKEVSAFPFIGVDSPGIRDQVAGFYDGVIRIDAGIAAVREELNKRGLAESTIIIFIGDHGPPFSRAKATLYEAGVKVPLIFHLPKGIDPGRSTEDLVSSVDIVPTILDLADIDAPYALSGESLTRLFRHRPFERGIPRDYLFTEFIFHTTNHYYPRRAVRDGKYKLIHNLISGTRNPLTGIGDGAYGITRGPEFDNNPWKNAYTRLVDPPEFELYDLEVDPFELVNLYDDTTHSGKAAALREALDTWAPPAEFLKYSR